MKTIAEVVAKMRADLTAVGGFENGMIYVPAEGVRTHIEALEAALAAPPNPLLLKGIGKIAGDGFKDETRIGEVIYAWNREHPAPHAPGQFPRLGNPVYAASTEQFDFRPVDEDELIAVVDKRIEELRMQVLTLQDEKRELLRTHAGAQAAAALAKLAAFPLTEHDEARPDRALFSAGDTSGDWTLKVADVLSARAALKGTPHAGGGRVLAWVVCGELDSTPDDHPPNWRMVTHAQTAADYLRNEMRMRVRPVCFADEVPAAQPSPAPQPDQAAMERAHNAGFVEAARIHGPQIERMADALRSIRAHCAEQPSALAAAIVATCDNGLQGAPQPAQEGATK